MEDMKYITPVTKVADTFFGRGGLGRPADVKRFMDDVAAGTCQDGSGGDIVVSGRESDAITVHGCYVGPDLIEGTEMERYLGPYDLSVFSACCGLFEAGVKTFTPRQVVSIMTGGRRHGGGNASAAEKAVTESLDRMMRLVASYDWSEQARAWGAEDVKTVVVMEAVLPAKKVEVTLRNGTKATGYEFLDTPQLYAYAKAVRQIITTPREALDVADMNLTERSVKIRDYLIYRIMRTRGRTVRIRFDTILEKCELTANTRNELKDIRNTAFRTLDHLVTIGMVLSYEKNTNARGGIESVEIEIGTCGATRGGTDAGPAAREPGGQPEDGLEYRT